MPCSCKARGCSPFSMQNPSKNNLKRFCYNDTIRLSFYGKIGVCPVRTGRERGSSCGVCKNSYGSTAPHWFCAVLPSENVRKVYLYGQKFYRFSDYLFISPQMLERLVISNISSILRFGRYPAYHGISEPHLALESSKTVVETAAYYYAASLSIAAFAEA